MADLRIARILIVESDHQTSCKLASMISDAGFDPWGTALGADMAVSLARSFKPDLAIVADRLCDGSDGLAAARRIAFATGARILMSAEQRAVTAQGAIELLGLLTKPHNATDVVNAVNIALTAMAADPYFAEPVVRVASSHSRQVH